MGARTGGRLGLGSVAGLGAARLAASHYSIMVKDLGDVRRRAAGGRHRLGEKRTKQELGGYKIQTRPVASIDAVDTEEEAFECARDSSPICRRRCGNCRRRVPC
jgi:hypothetical protein